MEFFDMGGAPKEVIELIEQFERNIESYKGQGYSEAQVRQQFINPFFEALGWDMQNKAGIALAYSDVIHEDAIKIGGTTSVKELRKHLGGSPRTLYNKIKFTYELRLIDWSPNEDTILLTNLGKEYCKRKDPVLPVRLSENQAALIRSFVMSNPYQSSVILGIASAVEAVFALSKNTYPVPMTHMMAYFTFHAGKYFDWQTDKAKYNATRMYTKLCNRPGIARKN